MGSKFVFFTSFFYLGRGSSFSVSNTDWPLGEVIHLELKVSDE